MNKTFQVHIKQAIPTEHFNYFHDHTALYAAFFLLLSLLIEAPYLQSLIFLHYE